MIELTAHEMRALGVLVEKAMTTPDQYPMSLNALVNGANQKNNRDPILSLTEDEALTAVFGLRDKGLVIQIDTPGARVSKYRHAAGEKLQLSTRELVVLTELLLRGPQTAGEIRGRASRMLPLETVEMVQATLDQLAGKPEPLVRQIPPSPGDRATRYVQLLCLEQLPEPAVAAASEPAGGRAGGAGAAGAPTVSMRLADLEARVAHLEAALRDLCSQLGVEPGN